MPLEVETMHSDESLSAFRPEWHSFWTACRTATPFQSPSWLLAWWKQFGSGRPRVIVLRRSETPVGVVPLFEDESPASRLQLMGFGITDRLDPLLGPDVAEQAATAALAR